MTDTMYECGRKTKSGTCFATAFTRERIKNPIKASGHGIASISKSLGLENTIA